MASNDNGGIFFNPEVNATLAVLNSTIYNNAYTFDFDDTCPPLGTCQITYSDIEGGWPASGNIDADPRSVNPDNGDYHLRTDSPCRDKGTPAGAPATEIEGTSRDATPDMGAYEWTGFRVLLPLVVRNQ